MKTLKHYITERFTSDKVEKYNYFPKDIFELRDILKERLEKDKNANLNDIDVSKITTFTDTTRGQFKNRGLFEGLDPHNIDISKWNVSNVEDMRRVFCDCKNLKCDVSKWNVLKVKSFANMFYVCHNFDCDLSEWKFGNHKELSFFGMFAQCYNFTGKGLDKWDVSKAHSIAHMFNKCKKLDVDLSNWKTTFITETWYVFTDCDTLEQKHMIPEWYKKKI